MPSSFRAEAADPVEETSALSAVRARQLMEFPTGESLLAPAFKRKAGECLPPCLFSSPFIPRRGPDAAELIGLYFFLRLIAG
jgi:hypothetical protein